VKDPKSVPDTGPSVPAWSREKLFDLARKRLAKFASLVPRALVSDQPDTIHDLRVWSRRLQQILQVLFSKPRANSGRKLIRSLRKVRRALGDCRDLDVTIELIVDKLNHANSEVVRNAWTEIQAHLGERRKTEAVRCRGELSRFDIMAFVIRTQELLQRVKVSRATDQTLRDGVEQALADWQDALTAARESEDVDATHAFRIAGKRLRYRAELLADLGNSSCKSLVKSLKLLQDDLGQWRDRHILLRFMAEFIGRPEFLVDQPEMSRILLTEMEKERQRNDSAMSGFLKTAEKIREWRLVNSLQTD
jgi:CHAD domain-containing protein